MRFRIALHRWQLSGKIPPGDPRWDVVGGHIVASGGVYVDDPWRREIARREVDILRLGLAPAQPPAPAAPPTTRPVDDSQLTEFDKLAAENWQRWQENEELERRRRIDRRIPLR